MELEYAIEHLTGAVRTLASGDEPHQERLQRAWIDHVQMLWERPCLTPELNQRFRGLWGACTAPGDDPRRTALRVMSATEMGEASDELLGLLTDTVAADARGTVPDKPKMP